MSDITFIISDNLPANARRYDALATPENSIVIDTTEFNYPIAYYFDSECDDQEVWGDITIFLSDEHAKELMSALLKRFNPEPNPHDTNNPEAP